MTVNKGSSKQSLKLKEHFQNKHQGLIFVLKLFVLVSGNTIQVSCIGKQGHGSHQPFATWTVLVAMLRALGSTRGFQ